MKLIKNILKKYDKVYQAEQNALKVRKKTHDKVIQLHIEEIDKKLEEKRKEYRDIFNGGFDFLGQRFVPYCISRPNVNFLSYKPYLEYEKEVTQIYTYYDEYKERKVYLIIEGEYSLLCLTNNKGVMSQEFIGEDKLNAIIKEIQGEKL